VSQTWLFHATRDGDRPLTRQQVFSDVAEAAKAASFDATKKISPLTIRHAFALHMIDNDFDKPMLAYMLGLADLGSLDRFFEEQ
jgi:site-specific recombinase XerD